jgi:ribosomal protein L29
MKKIVGELKQKNAVQLEKEITKQRELVAKLKLQMKVSPPKDVNQLGKEKKKLAQLITIFKEKKDAERLKKDLEKGKS